MELLTRTWDWEIAGVTWLVVIVATALIGFLVSTLVATVHRASFLRGVDASVGLVMALFGDLFSLSPRRLWALAVHNVLESIRRRMLLAILAVFLGLFLFAGWYLPSRPTEQVKVYVSFVFMAST